MANYYILYVEDSSPKMKVVTKEKSVQKFLNDFIKKHKSLDDGSAGNWVERVFHGKELSVEGTYHWHAKQKGS